MIDHEIVLVTELNDEAHQLDSTRLTTAASSDRRRSHPLNLITDVIGFNRYYGWYTENTDGVAEELDALHAAIPGRAFGISEYGAGASIYRTRDRSQTAENHRRLAS